MKNLFFVLASGIYVSHGFPKVSASQCNDPCSAPISTHHDNLFDEEDISQQKEILRTITRGYFDDVNDVGQSVYDDEDYKRIMGVLGSQFTFETEILAMQQSYFLNYYHPPMHGYDIAVRLVYDRLSPFIERLHEKHFNSDTHFFMANLYHSRGQYEDARLTGNYALFLIKKEKQEAILPPDLLKDHFHSEVLESYENFYNADFLGY